MNTSDQYKRKIVTIVTEAAIESQLLKDLEDLKATGYTITDARGKGSRGVRNAGWETSGNIRIEVICDTALADKIANYVKDKYYENYAMVIFMSDVIVLRPDKF